MPENDSNRDWISDLEKWLNEREAAIKGDPILRVIHDFGESRIGRRIIKRALGVSTGREIDKVIRMIYDPTKAEGMTIEEMANAISELYAVRLKPKRILNWVYLYQEKTGNQLLAKIPYTQPQRYRLANP